MAKIVPKQNPVAALPVFGRTSPEFRTGISMGKDCIRLHYSMQAKNEEKNGHALESRFPVFFYNTVE
ncbi:MAG: hypothetical protein LBB66_10255 [Desulfovibrio sp.]|nr:hypothetical protein [Desulfovibrio sp.]